MLAGMTVSAKSIAEYDLPVRQGRGNIDVLHCQVSIMIRTRADGCPDQDFVVLRLFITWLETLVVLTGHAIHDNHRASR